MREVTSTFPRRGLIGTGAPRASETFPDHGPAATTTFLALISPRLVCTPCTAPKGSRRRAVTSVSEKTRAPFLRATANRARSEEHTSELQSRFDLVCGRLLGKHDHL